VPAEEHPILAKLIEFEKTFVQRYGREMNTEERRVLRAAIKVIQRELKVEPSEKPGD